MRRYGELWCPGADCDLRNDKRWFSRTFERLSQGMFVSAVTQRGRYDATSYLLGKDEGLCLLTLPMKTKMSLRNLHRQ